MLWSKLTAVIAMQLVLSYILGRTLIPVFRRMKTGKYDGYIGDRLRTDGSEPAFGGAVMLLVLAFGVMTASAVVGEALRLYLVLGYIAAICLSGIIEDFMTDVCGLSYGLNIGVKLGWRFSASLLFLLIYKRCGFISDGILLPFRLGALELGAAFVPVWAAVMTAVIGCFSLFNRFGTDETTCCGGLAHTVIFIQGLTAAVIGGIISSESLAVFGYITSASALGALIWGLSPAKLRGGSSAGSLCGGISAALVCFTSNIEIAMLLAAMPAVCDAVCTAVQLAVYKTSRKLVFKGSSLHSHLKAKGMSDYKVILIFTVCTVVFSVGAVLYAVYSTNVVL